MTTLEAFFLVFEGVIIGYMLRILFETSPKEEK